MKKIICLFLLLALATGVHADDKKKKKPAANSASSRAPGGGGGGQSGGLSGLSRMGQPAGHSSAPRTSTRSAPSMSTHAPSARHTANSQSQTASKSGASNRSSNPLLRKGGQAGSTGYNSNPLTKTNQPAGTNGHSSNPLTQGNRQAGGKNAKPLTRNNAAQPKGGNARNGGMANNKNSPNLTRNRSPVAQGARGYNNGGSRNWQHSSHANYRVRNSREVFHNYRPIRHDRGWYSSHYDRVVVVGGGYYYWDAGYWYPAWGYDPAFSFYVYDGPIYSYDNLPPDQVTMNVQSALQDEGYYTGDIDGQVGPKTREALGAYQTDHNLEITSAVDEPTVESLGLT
jgi:hypothetical protein